MATARFYFDRRAKKDDGTYPLKITISHKGRTAHISLGVYLLPKQWDPKRAKVVLHAEKDAMNSRLSQIMAKIEAAMLDLRNAGAFGGKTITQVRDLIREAVDPAEDTGGNFLPFFRRFVDRHTNSRTRQIITATLQRVEDFDEKAKDLNFEDVTRGWLEDFDAFLAEDCNNATNTRSIHLRNIRAVFNSALDEGATTFYPFRAFRIKNAATPKRSLAPAQLLEIWNVETTESHRLFFDFLKLQFLLIGINTVDLLQNVSLNGGRVEYTRAKTHRFYSVKAEPEALEIIAKYKGSGGRLLSFMDNYNSYLSFAKRLNNVLHDHFKGLSTYYMRHSWATVAASLDIPKETIAAALGHGIGNAVTSIYIDFDRQKVDEANRRVIDFVLYGKK